MSTAASIIGALNTSGLEDYLAASGQPVSISSVGGVPVVSTGSVFTGQTGTVLLILLIVAAVIIVIAVT